MVKEKYGKKSASARSAYDGGIKSGNIAEDGARMTKDGGKGAKKTGERGDRRKKGGLGTVILDILLVVFLCSAIFSGYKVVSQLVTDKQGEDVYDDIASIAEVQETMVIKVTRPAPSATRNADGAGIAAVMETEPGESEPSGSEDSNEDNSNASDIVTEAHMEDEGVDSGEDDYYEEEPEQIVIRQLDWAALRSENSDCVGWLECDDTVINYPIVQGKDNSYYLNHLFNGKQQRYGTLFIDAQNSPDFSDENTIIYGHHLKNGKMFGTLMYYGDGNKYYRKHPVFKLYTPDHIYLVELFANAYVDGAKGIPMTFSTKEEYAAWIDRMYRLSTFDSDVVMTTEDRMVTLYTCSYDYDTQRQLLVGKLVPLT